VVVSAGDVSLGLAAGSVVSVFCSQAARSAALARMQMYFFIGIVEAPYSPKSGFEARTLFDFAKEGKGNTFRLTPDGCQNTILHR
jgi:hypothetical protein